jgi:hypothetical protein
MKNKILVPCFKKKISSVILLICLYSVILDIPTIHSSQSNLSIYETKDASSKIIINHLPKTMSDTLDQFQITWNGAVSVAIPDAMAQSFKPSVNMLTRVQILMHKSMDSTQNVTVSIRKELNGSDLTSISIPSELIPTSRSWVEFNFENISVTINDIYYIIWTPMDTNMSYLWWGYDNNNFDSYPRGEAWLYSGGTWSAEGFVFKDWCFKTYGYHASLPPSIPITPIGPTEGLSWNSLNYETISSDPEGDDIRYGWDWNGDGIIDKWTEYYSNNVTVNTSYKWEYAGTYLVKVKAEDIYGVQSDFSDPLLVNISNDPPYQPSPPNGTTYTLNGVTNTFSTKTLDPESDDIRYGWDWNGDGTIDEWTEYYPSNVTISRTYIWQNPGTYYIQVKAEDALGAQSPFSEKTKIIVISIDNDPPNKPLVPQGPSLGLTGTSYSYSSSTDDPNGDRIYYQFDWDDGTISEWVGPYDSGQTVTISHIWENKGSYQIKVKAKDEAGLESIWSDPLPITLAKTRMNQNILHRFTFGFKQLLPFFQSYF